MYHAPKTNEVNNLDNALSASGIHGFIFDSSQTPADIPYQTYNWCNMPHVRKQEYIEPPDDYEVIYVEVIHRHHKRTPYAANTFPPEPQTWDCTDTQLYQYAQPISPNIQAISAAKVYKRCTTSPLNPFQPAGFLPYTCTFPQITAGGLEDSHQHGKDLYSVYHDLLGLLPNSPNDPSIQFRVTNNPITSQVAGMAVSGMYPTSSHPDQEGVALHIQPPSVDSLEPSYPCPAADKLISTYGPGSSNPAWQRHLSAPSELFPRLDEISGVDPGIEEWHKSYDHYFDNLSARLCHGMALPCNASFSPRRCVTQEMADADFRLGEWEYSWLYRGAGPETLRASAGKMGVWVAELASHLRIAAAEQAEGRHGGKKVVYRHNVAHDGSLANLLSILQVQEMVWPGMGAEVVFELWK